MTEIYRKPARIGPGAWDHLRDLPRLSSDGALPTPYTEEAAVRVDSPDDITSSETPHEKHAADYRGAGWGRTPKDAL